jgi:hypothetical protein
MKVKLHQDVEGHQANDTIDVDEAKAEWLVSQGYASIEGDETDKTRITGPDVEKDPTLAANQRALGLEKDEPDTQEDPKAHEVFANMVKDPETGESVSSSTQVSPQRIGNPEAERQAAQAEKTAQEGDQGVQGTQQRKTEPKP